MTSFPLAAVKKWKLHEIMEISTEYKPNLIMSQNADRAMHIFFPGVVK